MSGHVQPFVVAVCGAADLGKSYMSQNLVNFLSHQGISATHLPLDAFLMDRTVRIDKGMSGYDLEAYDIETIGIMINDFHKGKTISYYPYQHESGNRSKSQIILDNSMILILDGLHSMSVPLRSFVNLGVFIYTEDNNLRKIRRAADILKRKQLSDLSDRLEPIEFQKYKTNVEPYRVYADLLVRLKEKWSYVVDENTKKFI